MRAAPPPVQRRTVGYPPVTYGRYVPAPVRYPIVRQIPPEHSLPVSPQHPAVVSPELHTYRSPGTYTHAPGFSGGSGSFHRFRGPVIVNPRHWGGWGWHHGIIWVPVPVFWGGGFWGPFGFGSGVSILFGSIVDYQDQQIYPSYEAASQSPGAQLLQNYGLQQTECGPPNLVVIWGPDNSVICAYPNNLVAPGNYQIDPTTLTLVSQYQSQSQPQPQSPY
jgi:hypothetical protein